MKVKYKKPRILFSEIIITDLDDGTLDIFEILKNYSFTAKRMYILSSQKKILHRGGHAHKKLNQIMICVKGSCNVTITNKKNISNTFLLNNLNQALFVPNHHWRTITLKPNSVLIVLASEKYIESDYERDFNNFLKN